MYWLIKNPETECVTIPDELIDFVIQAVDVPRGSFQLDPYEDYQFSLSRLPEVINNLQDKIDKQRQVNRQKLIRQFNLKEWEEWLLELVQAAEEKDRLLNILLKLETLCVTALNKRLPVFIYGN